MIDNITIGKTYDFFDDGKIHEGRRLPTIVKEIIPFDKIDSGILEEWKENVDENCRLYNKNTDYFIKSDLIYSDGDIEEIYFVRTTDNRWFSLGFWGGCLDIDGSLRKLSDARLNVFKE